MRWFWPTVVLAMALVSKALAIGECNCTGGVSTCPEGYCCSNRGFCGVDEDWCAPQNCQCNCWAPSPPTPPPSPTPPAPPSPISSIIDIYLFDELLKHRNDSICEHNGFYTYYAFITAANFFPTFGTTGDLETRKREIAAFLGQTSHETTGGWDSAPDGPLTWGYCWVTERDKSDPHCVENLKWSCVAGKYYYGRGPIQLSYNYNYGPAGEALGYDLLSDPDALENNSVLSFKSALWFWMTPQFPKPSCHDVMTGQWKPSPIDRNASRLAGFGVTTNIINGGLECNTRAEPYLSQQNNRIQFYEKYCNAFGVSYGDHVDCYDQKSFNDGEYLDM